jgi:O-acetyl-ADP-ribose deacetylase (regulator of RNase III)
MLGLRRYQGVQVDLFQGDLTLFVCDAMVAAANPQLADGLPEAALTADGGGVEGAMHRAAGPELAAACRALGRGCAPGEAVATGAGNLPARWVIHAVGPVWRGGEEGEERTLTAAYQAVLRVADDVGARHVAFASLATGAYGYPVEQAAPVAMAAVKAYLDGDRDARAVGRVTVVLHSLADYRVYQQALFAAFPDE